MSKSPDAFRTISEVAEWLDTPAHVLRFWESKFTQVKPVKRAGGRRYYRPADMELIGGIKKLLHDDGMTIKGVQKMLREQGVRKVSQLSQPVDGAPEDVVEAAPFQEMVEAEDTVVSFGSARAEEADSTSAAQMDFPEMPQVPVPSDVAPETGAEAEASPEPVAEEVTEAPVQEVTAETPESLGMEAFPLEVPDHIPVPPEAPADTRRADAAQADGSDLPEFLTTPSFPDQGSEAAAAQVAEATVEEAEQPDDADEAVLAEARRAVLDRPELAPVPQDAEIAAEPGALSHLAQIRQLTREDAARIVAAAEQLRALNARLTSD